MLLTSKANCHFFIKETVGVQNKTFQCLSRKTELCVFISDLSIAGLETLGFVSIQQKRQLANIIVKQHINGSVTRSKRL